MIDQPHSGNQLGNDGTRALVVELQSLTQLVHVDISNNLITDHTSIKAALDQLHRRGAVLVGDQTSATQAWLQSTPHNCVLNLSHQRINNWDLTIIGSCLHEINQLDLSDCKIGKDELSVLTSTCTADANRPPAVQKLILSSQS